MPADGSNEEVVMELTEHQVREGMMALGCPPAFIERAISLMGRMPRNPGAVGLTDDELKGTARDDAFIDPDDPTRSWPEAGS